MEAKLFCFLEIIGVGYKASTNPQGFILYLKLGFNHEIRIQVTIVKLSSHPCIGYASLPFSYHELHINNTKTIQNQKPFQNQNFNSHKLYIHPITLYK
jgi:hypothetical protein